MPVGDAEQVGTVDQGAQPELNEMGLTADEARAFDEMRAADKGPAPAGGDQGQPEAGADQGAQGADQADAGDDLGDDDAGADAGAGGDPGGQPPAQGQRQQAQPPKDGKTAADKGQQAQPGADKGGQQQQQAPKNVSYGKYRREVDGLTTRASNAEKAFNDERAARQKLEGRMGLLLEAINGQRGQAAQPDAGAQPAKPAAGAAPAQRPAAAALPDRENDPEPNPEDDPFAHSQWTRRELARTQAEMAEMRTQFNTTRQQTQQRDERTDLVTGYQRDIAQFKAQPEVGAAFDAAYGHLKNARFRQLGFTLYGVDILDDGDLAQFSPEQKQAMAAEILETFHSEEEWVAREAKKQNRSAAQQIFNLARANGFDLDAWKSKQNGGAQPPAGQAAQPPARQQQRNANGHQPPSASRELAAIRDGVRDSVSLSDGGTAGGDQMTMERLGAMSDEEFSKFYESLPKMKLDTIMGRLPS